MKRGLFGAPARPGTLPGEEGKDATSKMLSSFHEFLSAERRASGHNVPSVTGRAYVGCRMEIHAFQPHFLIVSLPTHPYSHHRCNGGGGGGGVVTVKKKLQRQAFRRTRRVIRTDFCSEKWRSHPPVTLKNCALGDITYSWTFSQDVMWPNSL